MQPIELFVLPSFFALTDWQRILRPFQSRCVRAFPVNLSDEKKYYHKIRQLASANLLQDQRNSALSGGQVNNFSWHILCCIVPDEAIAEQNKWVGEATLQPAKTLLALLKVNNELPINLRPICGSTRLAFRGSFILALSLLQLNLSANLGVDQESRSQKRPKIFLRRLTTQNFIQKKFWTGILQ